MNEPTHRPLRRSRPRRVVRGTPAARWSFPALGFVAYATPQEAAAVVCAALALIAWWLR